MDFRKFFSKRMLIPYLLVILVIGTVLWKISAKADSSVPEGDSELSDKSFPSVPLATTYRSTRYESGRDLVSPVKSEESIEDVAIQEQLNRDREEQKQTKYLKTKLEQTNLELEQEKAFAEISKLKMENRGAFKDPAVDGQKNLPEIIVEYIGGNSAKKEAILSIDGASYQVKEKSSPTDNVQVMAISDSSVTLHFSAPQELTKTIDYKPE